jgi:hypothetical protein
MFFSLLFACPGLPIRVKGRKRRLKILLGVLLIPGFSMRFFPLFRLPQSFLKKNGLITGKGFGFRCRSVSSFRIPRWSTGLAS